MLRIIRNTAAAIAVMAFSVIAVSGTGYAAAGSPPSGPIEPVKTGADLKLACGQNVDGFKEIVGEQMFRSMLIVQCHAFIGGISELIRAGQYSVDEAQRWKCATVPDDLKELSTLFVTWVGRRPTLMRQPAAVAFVEAIEMSGRCKDS